MCNYLPYEGANMVILVGYSYLVRLLMALFELLLYG